MNSPQAAAAAAALNCSQQLNPYENFNCEQPMNTAGGGLYNFNPGFGGANVN